MTQTTESDLEKLPKEQCANCGKTIGQVRRLNGGWCYAGKRDGIFCSLTCGHAWAVYQIRNGKVNQ